MTKKNIVIAAALVVIGLHASARFASAQSTPYKPPPSYKDYYSSRVQTARHPSVSPAVYTYDRVFYHNQAISPYTNLMRSSDRYVNSYQTYVRPEQKRREAQAAVEHKEWKSGASAGGTTGTPSPSAYQNRWYGGRQAMGLNP